VTQHLPHHLDVGAAGNHETGCGVAQLVRVQAGKTDRTGSCVEVTATKVGRPDRAAAPD